MEKDRSLEKGKKLKPNWLKSLSSSSRHRKTSSNKENTQNQNNNSDDSDSSADFVNRMSNRNTTNKHTNVLGSIVRHFNLKFLSRSAAEYQNREIICRNHNTASSPQTNGHLSHLMNHENLAISNDYVEVPTPAARSMPIDMRQSNYLNELAGINLNSLDVNRRSPMSPWELHPTNQNEMAMLNARILMTNYGWYRGSMSRSVAQKKLQGQPNGSFLLRNSQTNGYHFTLSFRSAGNTLHCRIEYVDGNWTIESAKYISIVDLIEDAMLQSKDHIFCYVKQNSHLHPPYPVRLTNPISKFDEVPSLQHICRYVIRSSDKVQNIDCLPPKLQEYVRANKYLNIRLDYFEDV